MNTNNKINNNSSNGILIIGEKQQKQLHPVTQELMNAGQILSAQSGHSLSVLVYNDTNPFPAKEALVPILRKEKPSLVLLGSTTFGRILGSSLSFSLNAEIIMDASALCYDPDTNRFIITKASPDGRSLANYTSASNKEEKDWHPILVAIRQGVLTGNSLANSVPPSEISEFLPMREFFSGNDSYDRYPITILHREKRSFSVPITKAKIILAQGRGLPGKEGTALIQKLCEKLHGVPGCSRPCVDAGWQDKSHQIGQSGIFVHPKLYLAFGISGAVQHMAGVKADCLIAVNTHADAPIFQYCDYGVVGDAETIIRSIIEKL